MDMLFKKTVFALVALVCGLGAVHQTGCMKMKDSGREQLEADMLDAAGREDWDAVKDAVEQGANVNVWNWSHATPVLHYACEAGDMALIAYLVEHDADVNLPDFDQNTPLHRAFLCKKNYAAVVKYLVEQGAEVNVQDREYEETPLHQACRKGDAKLVAFLVSCGADITIPDWEGITPMTAACKKGNLAVVTALLDWTIWGISPELIAWVDDVTNFAQDVQPTTIRAIQQALKDHKRLWDRQSDLTEGLYAQSKPKNRRVCPDVLLCDAEGNSLVL